MVTIPPGHAGYRNRIDFAGKALTAMRLFCKQEMGRASRAYRLQPRETDMYLGPDDEVGEWDEDDATEYNKK